MYRPYPRFALTVFLLTITLLPVITRAAEPQARTVRLIVDYGDGVQVHFTAIPWKPEMTALDAVQASMAHPRGLKFTIRGAGTTAFVTRIGDVANEGSGRENKNWMFRLNDKLQDVGAGGQKLAEGDVVLWRFETYDYN